MASVFLMKHVNTGNQNVGSSNENTVLNKILPLKVFLHCRLDISFDETSLRNQSSSIRLMIIIVVSFFLFLFSNIKRKYTVEVHNGHTFLKFLEYGISSFVYIICILFKLILILKLNILLNGQH